MTKNTIEAIQQDKGILNRAGRTLRPYIDERLHLIADGESSKSGQPVSY